MEAPIKIKVIAAQVMDVLRRFVSPNGSDVWVSSADEWERSTDSQTANHGHCRAWPWVEFYRLDACLFNSSSFSMPSGEHYQIYFLSFTANWGLWLNYSLIIMCLLIIINYGYIIKVVLLLYYLESWLLIMFINRWSVITQGCKRLLRWAFSIEIGSNRANSPLTGMINMGIRSRVRNTRNLKLKIHSVQVYGMIISRNSCSAANYRFSIF